MFGNRTGREAWRIVVPLVAVLAAQVPAAGANLKTFKDPVHKISLKVFADWKQVPAEAGDEHVVMKFYEPVNKGDYYFPPALELLRLAKEEGKTPVTGAEGRDLDKIPEEYRKYLEAQRPKSIFDLWARQFSRFLDQKIEPDDIKFRKIQTRKEKVEGKLYVHSVPFGKGGPDQTLYSSLATFEQDGVEYGIVLSCSERRGLGFARDFKSIAQSFVFFDKYAKDVAEIDFLKDLNLSPRRRAEIEAGVIKGWNVIKSPKNNYVIIYNTKNSKNHNLAKEIARRIEDLREQVYEVQFPPAHPIDVVSIVRVCGDRKEYHAYGGPGGSAGYWNSATEELVFYDASPARNIDDDTVSVLYHEAFHQYIYYSVGSVAPHSWFNEGHGDYYAGAKYSRSRKFKIEPFRWRVGIVKSAIREGPRPFTIVKDEQTGEEQKVWENKGYTPLADLVHFSQRDYYSYPGVSYAQGWSLVYFLREKVPEKKAYQAKWGHILDTYFDTLQAEVNKTDKLVPGGRQDQPDAPGDDPGTGGGDDEPREPADPTDPDEGDEGEEELSDIPPVTAGLFGSQAAKRKAVEEAFKGVDFAELEKAWIESTLKVSG